MWIPKPELDALKKRAHELELALKCVAAFNVLASFPLWPPQSPFQQKVEELIGKPPYGDKP